MRLRNKQLCLWECICVESSSSFTWETLRATLRFYVFFFSQANSDFFNIRVEFRKKIQELPKEKWLAKWKSKQVYKISDDWSKQLNAHKFSTTPHSTGGFKIILKLQDWNLIEFIYKKLCNRSIKSRAQVWNRKLV